MNISNTEVDHNEHYTSLRGRTYLVTPVTFHAAHKRIAHREVSQCPKIIEADAREPQSPETLKETPPKTTDAFSTSTLPVPKEN
jgi:hypothetical protein